MKALLLTMGVLLLGLGSAWAQKGKIKETAVPDTAATVRDTSAQAGGKAAIRGAALLQDLRDSLGGAAITPPADIVDTFGLDMPVEEPKRVFIQRDDLVHAQARIQDAKAQLADAQTQLDAAAKGGKYTPKQIEAAQARLDWQEERLKAVEADYDSLRVDWETATGLSFAAPVEQPSVEKTPAPAPAADKPKEPAGSDTPKPAGTSPGKAKITGGKGK